MTGAALDLVHAVEILRTLPAATIYEAAQKIGALDRSIQRLNASGELSGFAFTVRCEPYESLPVLRAIDLAAEGDVLVIDAGADGATVWGGTSNIAAHMRGLAGMVTNGAVRDMDEVSEYGFPVFAQGRTLHGTYKNKAGEIGGPIRIGGQTIMNGDFIRGDSDGVLVVPASRIQQVAEAGLIQRDKEEKLDAALRNGGRLSLLLGL